MIGTIWPGFNDTRASWSRTRTWTAAAATFEDTPKIFHQFDDPEHPIHFFDRYLEYYEEGTQMRLEYLMKRCAADLGRRHAGLRERRRKVVVSSRTPASSSYRYSTLGFQDAANLDDGKIWATSYALLGWRRSGGEEGRGPGPARRSADRLVRRPRRLAP